MLDLTIYTCDHAAQTHSPILGFEASDVFGSRACLFVCSLARFLATLPLQLDIRLASKLRPNGLGNPRWAGLAVFDPTSKPVCISHTTTTRFVPTHSPALKEGWPRAGLTSTLVAHPSR